MITVAVALPVFDRFTYSVPAHLAALTCPGKRVLVPFGSRMVTGYVLGPTSHPTDPTNDREIKPIVDVLDDRPLFPEALIPFFEWVADYYLHPLGQVINTALPGGLTLTDIAVLTITAAGRQALVSSALSPLGKQILGMLSQGPATVTQLHQAIGQSVSWASIHHLRRHEWILVDRQVKGGRVRPKSIRMVTVEGTADPGDRLSPQRRAIRDMLVSEGDLSVAALKQHIPTAASLVRHMHAAGQAVVYEKRVSRDPFGDPIEPDRPPSLTDEQRRVVGDMAPLLGRGFASVLLAGVTGSGKTEVYLRLTRMALDQGLHVLVLVPEIALISQTERRFRARFGEIVAVLHSGLTRGERYDQWRRIAEGKAAIAVGARSCIFAPFADVGLIIVDEEHDPSYKQEVGLHYNARDMAVVRARHHRALVVLGSATPSVQSWHNATIGKYTVAMLAERVNRQPLPHIQIVDLSQNRDSHGIRRYITPPLQKEIRAALDNGDQALIFLNRRGFAAFPICGQCGQALRCKNCDISLTLHKGANAFLCHYCGFSKAAISTCPGCGSDAIKLLGMGTEKIHEALTRLFPDARIARMDRDTTSRKGTILRMLKDLKERRIDILVGTQMVAKGHDFPGITLVGVVCADQTLNFPDFRSGERTFQLLAQVAGRAGRGDRPGKVILQTFNPEHFTIHAAKNQDFRSFFSHEIAFRKALQYPPFTRMVAIRISGTRQGKTASCAQAIGQHCRQRLADRGSGYGRMTVMGPIEAPLSRIANRYRWQLLISSPEAGLHRLLRELIHDRHTVPPGREIRVSVDVDPFYMM